MSASELGKDLNQLSVILALEARVKELEHENDTLRAQKAALGARGIRLEVEISQLRALRTDEALRTEVAGLRREVSEKDRKVHEYRQAESKLQTSEAVALKRAADAERRADALETTVRTFQRARDVAQEAQAVAERARVDAVRQFVDADDRAKRAAGKLLAAEQVVTRAADALKAIPGGLQNEPRIRALAAAIGAARK